MVGRILLLRATVGGGAGDLREVCQPLEPQASFALPCASSRERGREKWGGITRGLMSIIGSLPVCPVSTVSWHEGCLSLFTYMTLLIESTSEQTSSWRDRVTPLRIQ